MEFTIMYGRGAATIAEQIDCTPEDAQDIINSFYSGFPKVRKWIDATYEKAIRDGYVETIWGRRRTLKDIQLEPFELIQLNNTSSDSNPLFDIPTDVSVKEGDSQLINYYKKQLAECRYFKERENIIKRAFKDGIKVKDNNGYIASAKRQAVNTKIQGAAAMMSKRAMIAIHNNPRIQELGFRLLLAVHDELIGECPKENKEEVEKLLSQLMIQAATPECSVAMRCDATTTFRWYQDDFADSVEGAYKSLLKSGRSEQEAMVDLIKENEEISPEAIRSMCSGNYDVESELI